MAYCRADYDRIAYQKEVDDSLIKDKIFALENLEIIIRIDFSSGELSEIPILKDINGDYWEIHN